MSTPGHKPPSITPVPSSDEEEEETAEEEEDELQGDEELFHDDDNDYEEGDEDYEDGSNYDGNYDDEQQNTYSETSESSPTLHSSKWSCTVMSQISEIAKIYIRFGILAIIIYSVALWYTMYFGDTEAVKGKSVSSEDSDTCPAGLPE